MPRWRVESLCIFRVIANLVKEVIRLFCRPSIVSEVDERRAVLTYSCFCRCFELEDEELELGISRWLISL